MFMPGIGIILWGLFLTYLGIKYRMFMPGIGIILWGLFLIYLGIKYR